MEFTIDQKLMALSWKQPYGTLMMHGKIETRRWDTKYRGWVLICASKTPYSPDTVFNISGEEGMERIKALLNFRPGYCFKDMVLGHAIAVGRLVESRQMVHDDERKAFVTHYPDLFSHFYEDVRPIIPIPWKGTQGWKEVSMDIKEQIKFLAPFTVPEQYKDEAAKGLQKGETEFLGFKA